MKISESFEKINSDKSNQEMQKFASKAEEYALQGFSESQIRELLQIDECSKETANTLANTSLNNVPIEYKEDIVIASYDDVRKKIENTITTASIENIENYLNKYASLSEKDVLIETIKIARDNNSSMLKSEIHKILRPYIENIIIANNVMAKLETAPIEIDEKQGLEYDLFGILPVNMVQKQAKRSEIQKKIFDKAKTIQSGKIKF